MFDITRDYLSMSPYDKIFMIKKEFPIIDDGVRGHDENFQIFIENEILEILHKLHLPYEVLT